MDRRPSPTAELVKAGLSFVGMEHVDSETGWIRIANGSRTGEGKGLSFRFDERHVLFEKLRPYLRKVALPENEGCSSTELIPLLRNPDFLDRRFLFHWLRRPQVADMLMAKHTGARMPRADMSVLLGMPIPLPSLGEQRRIVALLNRAAEIRRRADAARTKARALIPALFLDTFGDPATNPKGWPVVRLGELGDLDRGRSRHRPRNAAKLYGGPHPFIQTGDVANSAGRIRRYTQTYSEAGLAQSRMWPAGTLCITIAANIAHTGILEFDSCFPDSVVGFRPAQGIFSEYIQQVLGLMRAEIEARAPQAAQKNINLQVLRELLIPSPPSDFQDVFSRRVRYIERFARALDAAAAKAEKMAAALAAELFDARPASGEAATEQNLAAE